MTKRVGLLVLVGALLGLGCSSQAPSILQDFSAEPLERYIWVGKGTSYRHESGEWVRTPDQDYDFLVKQDRYEGFWQSLKIQNRLSPDYDGIAGPADQQHAFLVEYHSQAQTETSDLVFDLKSTYGQGKGRSTKDFTEAEMEFSPIETSPFLPYNRYRITQNYDYEAGTLKEWVELFQLEDDGTMRPFVKIYEEAKMYF
jgi:hypothetical protein